jgi:hypothetical protein
MMPPGCERVVGKNARDGLGRDGRHDPVVDQLPSQLGTIPLREGPSYHLGAFARQFDHV